MSPTDPTLVCARELAVVAATVSELLLVVLEQLLSFSEDMVLDDAKFRKLTKPLLRFFFGTLFLFNLPRKGISLVFSLSPWPETDVLRRF